jgi:SAM-dependent methyltransferase
MNVTSGEDPDLAVNFARYTSFCTGIFQLAWNFSPVEIQGDVAMSIKNVTKNALSVVKLDGPARWVWHKVGPKHDSETGKCRARLAPFCVGYGLDLGFGGDPITEHAIRVDMPQPYTRVGSEPLPVQLGGQAEDLYWFRDGVLDFIYSSHLLEDYEDVEAVLREWLRVLRPGGRLIIFCPDEQAYRTHCRTTGQGYNTHHKHADFSLRYVKAILDRIGMTEVIYERPLSDIYSWEIVCVKK